MNKEPLTAKALDASGCGIPNCKHDHSVLYLHSRCHLKAGVTVRYEKESKLIIIECMRCAREVARILVAP